MAGVAPSDPGMARARDWILECGGPTQANVAFGNGMSGLASALAIQAQVAATACHAGLEGEPSVHHAVGLAAVHGGGRDHHAGDVPRSRDCRAG